LLVTIIGLHLLVIDVATFSPLALGMVSVAGLPGKEVHKSLQLQPGIEDGKVTVIRASGESSPQEPHRYGDRDDSDGRDGALQGFSRGGTSLNTDRRS
jgi:hypothetical protein